MKPCITCEKLKKCRKTTLEMLENDEGCALWTEAHAAEVSGRLRFAEQFGLAAILPSPNPPHQRRERMSVNRKALLRTLAFQMGVLEKSPAVFNSMKEKDFVEILQPHIENIEDMSDEDVDKMIEEYKAGKADKPAEKEEKPKGKPGRPAGKKPAGKKEEKEEETAEEPEPDPEPEEEKPKAKPGPKKPGRPAGKPSGKPAPKEEPAEEEEAGSCDLKPIIERLDTIGPIVGKNTKAIEGAQKTLDTIAAHLVWKYNNEVDADDQIKSLDDVDWGG
jgi:hypothetical protein